MRAKSPPLENKENNSPMLGYLAAQGMPAAKHLKLYC